MKTKISAKNIEDIAFDMLQPFSGKTLTLMVSGGSILKILESPSISELDKREWSVYFADERIVPPTDKDSNFKDAQTFLAGVGKSFPVDTSLDHQAMLDDYREKLQNAKFDLAFLGIGEDGHIASIFPESSVIGSSDIVAIISDSPKPPLERLTITPLMLTMVKRLVFFVPRLPNGMIKSVDEPHFSILSQLNTDILIVTVDPLS
ncbi:6-phosphogluconolactonase [Nematocida displodere]|uniref:6-phosphogluconolactonase n=1 Tax=Nematocida displodere TaxID=1805483 RepID=A0A177EBG8_9MICR|nr:6-phosphogluconolactonase [Nematocida displodere]